MHFFLGSWFQSFAVFLILGSHEIPPFANLSFTSENPFDPFQSPQPPENVHVADFFLLPNCTEKGTQLSENRWAPPTVQLNGPKPSLNCTRSPLKIPSESQIGEILPFSPREHLTLSGDIFGVTGKWEGNGACATGIRWVQPGMLLKHSAMHTMAATTENDPAPNVRIVEREKPWLV